MPCWVWRSYTSNTIEIMKSSEQRATQLSRDHTIWVDTLTQELCTNETKTNAATNGNDETLVIFGSGGRSTQIERTNLICAISDHTLPAYPVYPTTKKPIAKNELYDKGRSNSGEESYAVVAYFMKQDAVTTFRNCSTWKVKFRWAFVSQ